MSKNGSGFPLGGGRRLLRYQQELALRTRGPITSPEQVAAEKKARGWPATTDPKAFR